MKDLNKRALRTLICVISVIALVFLDQIAKNWAVLTLKDKDPIVLIKNTLELYYLPNGNTGAAFGLLQGHQSLFLIIATLVCAILFLIIYVMPFGNRYIPAIVVMTFIIAGGFGNMIDRIQLNYVIDFIYFCLIDFPIFNVADMYVSVSTVVLVIIVLFYYKDEDFYKLEQSFRTIFHLKPKNEKSE